MGERQQIGRRGGLTSYGDAGFSTFMRRSFAKGMGYSDEDLRRPVIGICNTFDRVCNVFREQALFPFSIPLIIACERSDLVASSRTVIFDASR